MAKLTEHQRHQITERLAEIDNALGGYGSPYGDTGALMWDDGPVTNSGLLDRLDALGLDADGYEFVAKWMQVHLRSIEQSIGVLSASGDLGKPGASPHLVIRPGKPGEVPEIFEEM